MTRPTDTFIAKCKRCNGRVRLHAPIVERREVHRGYGRIETHLSNVADRRARRRIRLLLHEVLVWPVGRIPIASWHGHRKEVLAEVHVGARAIVRMFVRRRKPCVCCVGHDVRFVVLAKRFLRHQERSGDIVKALSVKNPWARLISLGIKTIELRSKATHYRGELLICASGRTSKTAEALLARETLLLGRHGYQSELYGVATCIVRVVDCRPATAGDATAACCAPAAGSYAWVLEHVRNVAPVPVKGALSFFHVELSL